VEYPPHVIAVSAIFLAFKMLNEETLEKDLSQKAKKKWWEAFGVTQEQLNGSFL
jgi:hypothetical protein